MITESIALEHKKLDYLRGRLMEINGQSDAAIFMDRVFREVAIAMDIPEYVLTQPWIHVQRHSNGRPVAIERPVSIDTFYSRLNKTGWGKPYVDRKNNG